MMLVIRYFLNIYRGLQDWVEHNNIIIITTYYLLLLVIISGQRSNWPL